MTNSKANSSVWVAEIYHRRLRMRTCFAALTLAFAALTAEGQELDVRVADIQVADRKNQGTVYAPAIGCEKERPAEIQQLPPNLRRVWVRTAVVTNRRVAIRHVYWKDGAVHPLPRSEYDESTRQLRISGQVSIGVGWKIVAGVNVSVDRSHIGWRTRSSKLIRESANNGVWRVDVHLGGDSGDQEPLCTVYFEVT